ncbi:sporulation protein rmd1 [Stygiomarasmius scandens]|uniref:Sporulation protein rmd1 n=1 Tax=Marasmiellus scandens TaxID=2682957 RepID=A0ABR1J996_9AGAR
MPLPEESAEPKTRGANRSTKVAGKLKVLPEQPEPPIVDVTSSRARGKQAVFLDAQDGSTTVATGDSDDGDIDEDSEEPEEVEVYNQISLIPDGTARRDALRLTKKKAKSLPRVTAYATATSFRMEDLMKFLNARRSAYHTNPKLIDEVIYSPYVYQPSNADDPSSTVKSHSHSIREGDLLGVPELHQEQGDGERTKKKKSRFDATTNEAEIFLFEYGTVVIWGMSEAQEKRFLSSIKRFEIEKLNPEDIEMEDLNYYYANYSRIYNDVITLRKGSSYMTKLSLSHALSQSVKISLFEKLISNTIEETKDIPEIISETGKIGMPHKEIMQQIGQLFLLRTNINSVGSVLDSPEVFWSFPDLQPLYEAARSYLEIPQRINLLNTRVEVLQDMLQLLKESVSSKHAERLEQIVIALIAIEIVLGIVTILVDLMA